MLIHEILDAEQILLLPALRSHATHCLCGLREVWRLGGVAVIQVRECRVCAVIWNAGEFPAGIVQVRGSKPVETVGKMVADPKAQSTLSGGARPLSHDIAPGAGGYRIPARLMARVPQIVVVMMNSHAEEVLRSSTHIEVDQSIGVPLVCRKQRDQVLVTDLALWPEPIAMVPVLIRALYVHRPRTYQSP